MNASRTPSLLSLARISLAAMALSMPLLVAPMAYADPGKTVFNVVSYGAKGNKVADDRGAIQAALDAAKLEVKRASGTNSPAGAIVYFPEGVYRVSSTLNLDNIVGIELVGAGMPAVDIRTSSNLHNYAGNPNNPLIYDNGPQTSIIADFDSSILPRPLFSFTGQIGHSMHDMALYGCIASDNANRSNCSALIQTASLGWGNSGNTYRNLVLTDAIKGVRLGSSASDFNNSEIIFENVAATTVDTVFQPQTNQALDLVFRLIGATNCKTVFDFDNLGNGGGNVSVDTVSLTACGGPGAEDWIIKVFGQPNTGVYRFNNIRPETTTDQILRSRGWGVTAISNLQDSRTYKMTHPPLVRLEGGSVVIECSDLLPNPSGNSFGSCPVVDFVPAQGIACTIRMRDCLLPATRPVGGGTSYLPLMIKNLATGTIPLNCYYRVDACDGSNVVPLTNASSTNAW